MVKHVPLIRQSWWVTLVQNLDNFVGLSVVSLWYATSRINRTLIRKSLRFRLSVCVLNKAVRSSSSCFGWTQTLEWQTCAKSTSWYSSSISHKICKTFMLCFILLWLYQQFSVDSWDTFTHSLQVYFTVTGAIMSVPLTDMVYLRLWLVYVSIMMTSSNGSISRVTGHLCGEFTGPRWIPHTKASDAELWCFLWSE